MEKYSNGTKGLSLQALFAHVSNDNLLNAMVRRIDSGNVRRVIALSEIRLASILQVLRWERQISGTVVPLCDFHCSSTLTLWLTGGLPP